MPTLLLASSGISLVLATLAAAALLRLHQRRIVLRGFRLWRPLPEDVVAKPAALATPVPAQMNLFRAVPDQQSSTTPDFAYPDNSLVPDPSRRTRAHAIPRIDRAYFHEDPGNLDDPAPAHRIAPNPVSLPARETRYPRKTA